MVYRSGLRLLFRSLWNRLEIDRAISYVLLTRGWQTFALPITLLLIARYFSPELQGFYYTFGSLLALQVFFELGFALVIVNVASHEWSRLELDENRRVRGDAEALSRLISLGRLIFKWYAVISLIFVLAVGTGGYFFLSQHSAPGLEWRMPWLAVVFLTGLLLWALPFNSLLEGCNQIEAVARVRLTQAVLENASFWIAVATGLGLWAAAIAIGVKVVRDVFLFIQYRHFFEPFLKPPPSARISWSDEVWPMQWRLGVQGLLNYFLFSLFDPVMFHYHGPVIAGQMGMTRQLATGIQIFAAAWLSTRVPRFGMLIAKRRFGELDRFWLRSSVVSLSVVAVGGISLWMLIASLNAFDVPIAQRFLSPLPTALFLLATLMIQIIQCQAVYLRAHKREPFLVSGVVTGLASGLLVWQLGARYGPTGAAAAYLTVMAFIAVPWITAIWIRARTEWHSPEFFSSAGTDHSVAGADDSSRRSVGIATH